MSHDPFAIDSPLRDEISRLIKHRERIGGVALPGPSRPVAESGDPKDGGRQVALKAAANNIESVYATAVGDLFGVREWVIQVAPEQSALVILNSQGVGAWAVVAEIISGNNGIQIHENIAFPLTNGAIARIPLPIVGRSFQCRGPKPQVNLTRLGATGSTDLLLDVAITPGRLTSDEVAIAGTVNDGASVSTLIPLFSREFRVSVPSAIGDTITQTDPAGNVLVTLNGPQAEFIPINPNAIVLTYNRIAGGGNTGLSWEFRVVL